MWDATLRIIILGILILSVCLYLYFMKGKLEPFQSSMPPPKLTDPDNPFHLQFKPAPLELSGNTPVKATYPNYPKPATPTLNSSVKPTRSQLIEALIANAQREYEQDNTQELETGKVESAEEELPNFGAMLTEQDFDALPPDQDNKDLMPIDYLWGIIPDKATKLIFRKNQIRAQMQGLTGLIWDDNSQSYSFRSPLLGVSTENENAQKGLQMAEAAILLVAAPLVDKASGKLLSPITNSVHAARRSVGGAAGRMATSVARVGGKVKRAIGARLAKTVGGRAAKKLAAKAAQKISVAAARSTKYALALPIGPFITGTLLALYATLLILANEFLANISDEIGCCETSYTAIDKIIPSWANEILGLIDGVGDVFSLFQPYTCVRGVSTSPPFQAPDVRLKQSLITPIFLVDPSLSQYLHQDENNEFSCENKPPKSIEATGVCVCDFSAPELLDSMAQFQQEYSIRNSSRAFDQDEAGNQYRIYSFITKFYAVRASSTRSCDVIVDLIEVRQDPVTGERQSSRQLGKETRRFYFMIGGDGSESMKNTFVVVGCTSVDHTGTEIEDADTDPNTNNEKCITLPKTFSQTPAGTGNGKPFMSNPSFMDIMKLGATAGVQGQVKSPALQVGVQFATIGSGANTTTNIFDNKTTESVIQQGEPVEKAKGQIPKIEFCKKVNLSIKTCMDPQILRKSIDQFHKEYPKIHIKNVKKIEPAGSDSCWYQWEEVPQNPDTNVEDLSNKVLAQTIFQQQIADPRTCTFVNPKIVRDASAITAKRNENPRDPITQTPITQIQIPQAQGSLKNGFEVPRPVPAERILGGSKCLPPGISGESIDYTQLNSNVSLKCENPAFLSELVTAQNRANDDSKILKCHMALTPKENRCDLEVDIQRKLSGMMITSRETLAVQVKPKDSSNPCQQIQEFGMGPNSGTFIQDNTPRGEDVSGTGGVLSFMKSMVDSVKRQFGNTILPILNLKASDKISQIALETSQSVDTMFETVQMNQELDGCPTKKCSDPDILRSIIDSQNRTNSPKNQFGVEKHTMKSILKAGIANKTSCDILFEDLVEQYEDLTNDPVESKSMGRAMRFTLQHMGNCKQNVVAGAEYDVSSNAIGLKSAKTLLTPTFRLPPESQLNCNDPKLIQSLKTDIPKLNPNDTYQKILASIPSSSGSCDQKVTKDSMIYDEETGESVKVEGIDSFIQMSVGMNPSSGGQEQKSVKELVIDSIEKPDGDVAISVNGVEQDPPYIYTWDPTMKNKRVNTNEISLTY